MSVYHLDFETRSTLNLKKVGAARYAEDCEILCAAVARGTEAPVGWEPGEPFPLVPGPEDIVVAHNALFEIMVWWKQGPRYGFPPVPGLPQWRDTMAMCSYAGLPRGLGAAVWWAGLGAEYAKDTRGKALIQKLCKPQKPDLYHPDVWFRSREEFPALHAELLEYCKQDVVAERALCHRLPDLPPREQKIWVQTQRMNLRGIPVDWPFVRTAVETVQQEIRSFAGKAKTVTGGAVTSLSQTARIKQWCLSRGVDLPNVTKKSVTEALGREIPNDVRLVLGYRAQAGLASIKKYAAAFNQTSRSDYTMKGSQIYFGAGTGRWSATGFQPHNIARPTLSPEETDAMIRKLTAGERPEKILEVLSGCLRGVIRAAPGKMLVGGDYSQIEVRVLLWLAGEDDRLQEIADGRDPYKPMAAAYYDIPVAEVTKSQRQVGKSAVLGCGFGVGATAFQEYAENYDVLLSLEEAEHMVKLYRSRHPKVQSFWYDLNDAAILAVEEPGRLVGCRRVKFKVVQDWLTMRLPSGRALHYFKPKVELLEKPWGIVKGVTFLGTDTYTRKYDRTHTYGAKLVENATQATARDVMAQALLRAELAGLRPILTVHDEILAHTGAPDAETILRRCMLEKNSWSADLPLDAETWTGNRYRK